MKLLLTTLNAKYVHANLALRYLYTNLIDSGFPRENLTLTEFTINQEEDYILGEIVRGGYDIVCMSCYIWNIDQTLSLCENVKKALPKIRIILGGPEVSFNADELIKSHSFIDAIAPGELKDTPFPYRYLEPEQDKVVYYESMRGCPFTCTYCLSSIDRSVECLPLERVYGELSFLIKRCVKQIKFIDRTFNFDEKRAARIMSYIMDHDNGITNFHFEMCAGIMTDHLIGIMAQARKDLFQIEIGIQSTNSRTLEACRRRSDFDAARQNICRLRQNRNIHIHLDLIAGLPFETYESFQVSFNEVYKIKPDHLQLGFLKLLRGSPIREESSIHDYCYRSKAPYEVISNAYISATELLELKKVEKVLNLFYNRGGFEKTLSFCTEGLSEPPFFFFKELADYFYLNGHQGRSWKKEELYYILHTFISQREEYDIKSRKIATENLKNEMQSRRRIRHGEDIKREIKKLIFADMTHTLNEDAVKRLLRKYPLLGETNV